MSRFIHHSISRYVADPKINFLRVLSSPLVQFTTFFSSSPSNMVPTLSFARFEGTFQRRFIGEYSLRSPNHYWYKYKSFLKTIGSSVNQLVQKRCVNMRSSVKLRCEHCYFARHDGRLYVRCKIHPRHKQRQGRCKKKH